MSYIFYSYGCSYPSYTMDAPCTWDQLRQKLHKQSQPTRKNNNHIHTHNLRSCLWYGFLYHHNGIDHDWRQEAIPLNGDTPLYPGHRVIVIRRPLPHDVFAKRQLWSTLPSFSNVPNILNVPNVSNKINEPNASMASVPTYHVVEDDLSEDDIMQQVQDIESYHAAFARHHHHYHHSHHSHHHHTSQQPTEPVDPLLAIEEPVPEHYQCEICGDMGQHWSCMHLLLHRKYPSNVSYLELYKQGTERLRFTLTQSIPPPPQLSRPRYLNHSETYHYSPTSQQYIPICALPKGIIMREFEIYDSMKHDIQPDLVLHPDTRGRLLVRKSRKPHTSIN